ncbi:DUF4942 domain-containing protein [Tenacibaculum phage Larrie]|nr:DUF4942 domain-containing protein [Tenacibaculum phage Larrie]
MFDKEFYPTPVEVLDLMQIDCNNKIVLEPSAGKGDIVDYLLSRRAKEVIACEKNSELRKIVNSKCEVYKSDFFELTAEEISHINMIVMNPPFSNADKHIEHAYNIAPEGCEIVALCNWQTIEKYSRHSRLKSLVDNYGTSENLGDCFKQAERKTGVEIGLVKLFKPNTGQNNNFEGFFMDEEEVYETFGGESSIMPYNEVRALVNRYVGAVKVFNEMFAVKERLTYSLKPLGISDIEFNVGYNNSVKTKEQFAKDLQIKSWSYIFNKMNMQKYVTRGVMKDVNTFVKTQSKYPFTEKNVYRMFEIIVGTRQNSYNRALEEAIDNFTKHTHKNRFGVEGWKTNSGYMLNKKFIVDWMVEPNTWSNGKVSLRYNSNQEQLEDLIKVLCNITGVNYDNLTTLNQFYYNLNGFETNKWYSWTFFEFKVFKKGTMHLKFKSEDDWYKLNKAYGELKGFTLSESYK